MGVQRSLIVERFTHVEHPRTVFRFEQHVVQIPFLLASGFDERQQCVAQLIAPVGLGFQNGDGDEFVVEALHEGTFTAWTGDEGRLPFRGQLCLGKAWPPGLQRVNDVRLRQAGLWQLGVEVVVAAVAQGCDHYAAQVLGIQPEFGVDLLEVRTFHGAGINSQR